MTRRRSHSDLRCWQQPHRNARKFVFDVRCAMVGYVFSAPGAPWITAGDLISFFVKGTPALLLGWRKWSWSDHVSGAFPNSRSNLEGFAKQLDGMPRECAHVGNAVCQTCFQCYRPAEAKSAHGNAGMSGIVAIPVVGRAGSAGLAKTPSCLQPRAHGIGHQSRIRFSARAFDRRPQTVDVKKGRPSVTRVDHPAAAKIGRRAVDRQKRSGDRALIFSASLKSSCIAFGPPRRK
jgi:hypothetical protein